MIGLGGQPSRLFMVIINIRGVNYLPGDFYWPYHIVVALARLFPLKNKLSAIIPARTPSTTALVLEVVLFKAYNT